MRRITAGLAGGLRFPSAANTGATLGSLTSIPASGTGWTWNGTKCQITGANATVSGYSIPGYVSVEADGVTVTGCNITGWIQFGTTSGSNVQNSVVSNCVVSAAQFRGTATNCTVTDCTISGSDASAGQTLVCVVDINATSAGCTVQRCNLYWASTYVEMYQGTIQDCYMHDIGYINPQHLDGIHNTGGGTGGQLNILRNTVLLGANQTGAIVLNQNFGVIQNVTVQRNLIAGGDYTLYAGAGGHGATSNVVITDNYWSTAYYPNGGNLGPTAHWDGGSGDVWARNYWYDGPNAGQAVAAPGA